MKENLKALDVQWLRSMKELEEERDALKILAFAYLDLAASESSPQKKFQRTRAWRMLTEDMATDGQRYGNSAIIVGVMKKCGLSLDEALMLFDQYATYGDSFTRRSVERMYRQFS